MFIEPFDCLFDRLKDGFDLLAMQIYVGDRFLPVLLNDPFGCQGKLSRGVLQGVC